MVQKKLNSYTNIVMDPDNFSMTSVWPWQDLPADEVAMALEGAKIEKAAVHNGELLLMIRGLKGILDREVAIVRVKAADESCDVTLQGIQIKDQRIVAAKEFLTNFTEWQPDEEYRQG